VFAILNFGFKNFRLINTKGEAQSQAEVALGRISSDLLTSDIKSMVIGTAIDNYMVFDTAIDPNTNLFVKDGKHPLWQGFVLYYTYSPDPNAICKKLMRKYVPHDHLTSPSKMTNIALYLTDTYNDFEKEELRIVAKDIYGLEISHHTNNLMVDIALVTWKDFLEERMAYQKDFSDVVAKETVRLKVSVLPRNTQ